MESKQRLRRFVITFDQVHRHEVNGQVYNKDNVAVIAAKDEESARKIAFDSF